MKHVQRRRGRSGGTSAQLRNRPTATVFAVAFYNTLVVAARCVLPHNNEQRTHAQTSIRGHRRARLTSQSGEGQPFACASVCVQLARCEAAYDVTGAPTTTSPSSPTSLLALPRRVPFTAATSANHLKGALPPLCPAFVCAVTANVSRSVT